MKVPSAYAVGTATHTGWVRANNEDDFLVGSAPGSGAGPMVCAVADGMGGAAGGAEASRLGLRALGNVLLDVSSPAPIGQRLADGFAAAGKRVFAEAETVPALRGMGTTLSALCLQDGKGHIGHVGDTRIYRLRAGECEQLTTDHAVREPDNLLLRCIGGGQPACEVDHAEFPLRAGDRFLLATDGVWSALQPDLLCKLLGRGEPQAAADALVAQSLAAGGHDNATAVVMDVLDPAGTATSRDVDLPRDERPGMRDLWPRPVSLRAPVWPWVLWALAAFLLVATLLRWWSGFDLWLVVRGLLRST